MIYRGKSRTISQANQLPLFVPESTWKPRSPTDWPDFRQQKIIGFDTEAHDPNLAMKGPGYLRGDAFVCGISLASADEAIYLPIRHVEDNYDPDIVVRYVKDQLKANNKKCGANLIYDLEALWSLDITEINGKLCDIQTAEPLLDEERKDGYSLEALSQYYLGTGKVEAGLLEAASIYGVEPKKGMHYIPARFVAEYAEADAQKPIEIFLQQENKIYEEELERVWKLESELLPVLWKMRRNGVRVDLEYFHSLSREYQQRQNMLQSKMDKLLGRHINFNSSKEIGYALEMKGYKHIRIVNGELSVDNAWLTKQKDDDLCETIRHLRVVAKMKKDFVDNILQSNVNGRVHPQWHALRSESEEGDPLGTRSGRMSSTKLNLQQIPIRDPIYGPEIRKGFVGEVGEKFIKNDWSSQEPRWVIEFAYKLKLPVSDVFMKTFKEKPDTDYHRITMDLIKARAQMDLPRPQAKDLSLGSLYGMQRKKMALRLGVNVDKGDEILRAYHLGVPFVAKLIDRVQARIEHKGYVRTITGRKRRFKRFEPSDYEVKKMHGYDFTVGSEEEAIRLWGSKYQRAYKHKGLNAIIQGSSGDQCKECIVELDRRGITPLMAVHDELNASSGSGDYVTKTMRHVMSTHMQTEIPFHVGQDIYDSWGGNREGV